ncbi:fimbria/pilus outer membrane usher protein [Pantoea sp. SIMBA_133]
MAQSWEFDISGLDANASEADVALLGQGGQLPGTYQVDILLNGEPVDFREMTFHQTRDAQGMPVLQPCLSTKQLHDYGIRTKEYPALNTKKGGINANCADISAIPYARAEFNLGLQQLTLSVPQAALRPELKGIAPRTLWNDGVPAFLMNYRASVSRVETKSGPRNAITTQYLQLEPGANYGPWRLRSLASWQQTGGQPGRWQLPHTWLERGLYDMQSRLTIGERFTSSDIFPSIPFRGVMLGRDENMVPASLRAFSPVVRGIARTQARVEVKQSGYTVYSGIVAPGPFAISDIAVSGSGSDLEVTVWEADGNNQQFSVPCQMPAITLQEGQQVYSLMVGQYHPADNTVTRAPVGQATLIYGLPKNLTLYGGLQGAEHYQAVTAGAGISLGSWGAVSLDGTLSRSQQKGKSRESGGYGRLRYSKSVEKTGTSFAFSATRYSATGDNNLFKVLSSYRPGGVTGSNSHRQTESLLTIGQSLGVAGRLSLTRSRSDNDSGRGSTDWLGAGYSAGICGFSLAVNVARSHSTNPGCNNRLVSVMVSAPLDRLFGGNTRATWQMTSPSAGGRTQQVQLSGRASDNQLRWSVTQRQKAVTADRHSSDLSLGWGGRYGQLNGSYGYSESYRQTGLDASGSMVITGSGVTFGQTLNDTVALIAAPGMSGIPVGGWPGVRTDFRGYTTLSGLRPYRTNVVSLDPAWTPDDAEIKQTDVTVVPTQGAVVPVTFVTSVGGKVLVTLTRRDGKPVPFGAMIVADNKDSVGSGIADENGRVYLSGLDARGTMTAKWGHEPGQQCRARYQLPKQKGPAGLYVFAARCDL